MWRYGRTTRSRAGFCAGRHPAGLAPLLVRIRTVARRQSILPYGVEDPRGLWQRPDCFDRSDTQRLSLAGYTIRIAPLRRRQDDPLAASRGPASPLQLYF